jgi:hypothetical protein
MTTSQRAVAEEVSAIDELVSGLLVAIASLRDRPVDWDDVEALGHLHEHLAVAAKVFDSAQAHADLRRAARKVSVTVRRLAAASP